MFNETIKKTKEKLGKFLREKGFLKTFLYFILFLFVVLAILSLITSLLDYVKSYNPNYKSSQFYYYYYSDEEPDLDTEKLPMRDYIFVIFRDKDFESVEKEVLEIIEEKCNYYRIMFKTFNREFSYYKYYLLIEIDRKCYKSLADSLVKLKPYNYRLTSNLDEGYHENKIKNLKEKLKIEEKRLNNLMKKKIELMKSLNETSDPLVRTRIIEEIRKVEEDIYSTEELIISKIKREIELLTIYKDKAYIGVEVAGIEILDWEKEKRKIKESWLSSFKVLIESFNNALIGLTVGLLDLIIKSFVVFINIFIIAIFGLLFLKIIWKIGKKIWKT